MKNSSSVPIAASLLAGLLLTDPLRIADAAEPSNHHPTTYRRNPIDLDLVAIEGYLRFDRESPFGKAKHIYENGGHAPRLERLTLANPLNRDFDRGAKVVGTSLEGDPVHGQLAVDYKAGSTELILEYGTYDDETQTRQAGCFTGGYGSQDQPNAEGCLATRGTLEIHPLFFSEKDTSTTIIVSVSYTLQPSVVPDVTTMTTTTPTTLKDYSTNAGELLMECENCPYQTFEKFYDYYGRPDYADHWIESVLDGNATDFKHGNALFDRYGVIGRTHAVQLGIVLQSVWMYVLKEMETALDTCRNHCVLPGCNHEALEHWNDAVALYTGSLMGPLHIHNDPDHAYLASLADIENINFADFSGNWILKQPPTQTSDDDKNNKNPKKAQQPWYIDRWNFHEKSSRLLYSISDARCNDFNTCRSRSTNNNLLQMAGFNQGAALLGVGACAAARETKEAIEKRMAVPLIQGLLRANYIMYHDDSIGEEIEAQGAAYAAAVLPLVYYCDPQAARFVWDSMKTIPDYRGSFREFRRTVESTYECLGIEEAEVGYFWNHETNEYYEGAGPILPPAEEPTPLIVIAGGLVGGILLICAGACVFLRRNHIPAYDGRNDSIKASVAYLNNILKSSSFLEATDEVSGEIEFESSNSGALENIKESDDTSSAVSKDSDNV